MRRGVEQPGSSSGSTREVSSLTIMMSTKLIGDIAEQAVILQALKQGWGIAVPVGDRLPYDLVFDVHGTLVKIQVKSAWFSRSSHNYVVDVRRTKTNRRIMRRSRYQMNDFDFAIVYAEKANVFYVIPIEVFVSYGSEIHFVETDKRQRKPRSVEYREAWMLISQWATQRETSA
ncbi:MAG: hypothetical protein UY79_C0003G0055 [Parcubacteria group bacterium GW2011_GWA2_53_21]|nr:MAG: hypothetical protein UY79_C0003G0055 [Parcubacteria group bacterium GW2011_GWA2_53_21]